MLISPSWLGGDWGRVALFELVYTVGGDLRLGVTEAIPLSLSSFVLLVVILLSVGGDQDNVALFELVHTFGGGRGNFALF